MKIILLFIASLFIPWYAHAQSESGAAKAQSESSKFESDGFSIDSEGYTVKKLPNEAGSAQRPIVALLLAPKDGFSPNVNVIIQTFPGTMDDYITETKSEFTQAKLNLVKEEKVGDDTRDIEYEGTLQGTTLHWFARASRANGKVYLITATTKPGQWSEYSPKLIQTVKSFALSQ